MCNWVVYGLKTKCNGTLVSGVPLTADGTQNNQRYNYNYLFRYREYNTVVVLYRSVLETRESEFQGWYQSIYRPETELSNQSFKPSKYSQSELGEGGGRAHGIWLRRRQEVDDRTHETEQSRRPQCRLFND